MIGANTNAVLHYALPMLIALVGGITALAPGRYFPVAAQVLGAFQSFRLLPVALQALIRPKGLIFKVTPKGSAAAGAGWETGIWLVSTVLIGLTALGLALNAWADYRVIDQEALLPVVAIWGAANIIVLLLVAMMCLQKPALRSEERFALTSEVTILTSAGEWYATDDGDISLTGLGIRLREEAPVFRLGETVSVLIGEVGAISGHVVRTDTRLAIALDLADSAERDRLIMHLFTGRIEQYSGHASAWQVTAALLKRLWTADLSNSGASIPVAPADDRKLSPASRAIPGRRIDPGSATPPREQAARRSVA